MYVTKSHLQKTLSQNLLIVDIYNFIDLATCNEKKNPFYFHIHLLLFLGKGGLKGDYFNLIENALQFFLQYKNKE